MSARLLVAAAAVLALLTGAALVAPATSTVRESATVEHVVHVEHVGILPPVTYAAVGDSITTLEYLGVARGELSWINHTDYRAEYVGGWAQSGATSTVMAANIGPVDADVLVVMAGTNDVNGGADPHISMIYVDLIVAGVGADQVIVSAIAPTDRHPAEALAYNAVLAEHAAAMGWTFVDPWIGARAADGTYIAGTAYDELHPNGATQEITGSILSAAIWDLGTAKSFALAS